VSDEGRALRVWLLPSAYAPHRGGIETVTAQLAHELTARGHEVLVVANQHPRTLAADEVVDGIRVVRVPYAARRRTPTGAARFISHRRNATAAVMRLEPTPDIIHVHGVSSQADAALRAARHRRAALVVTTHGEITADAHGLFEHSYARRALRRLLAAAAEVTVPSAWVATDSRRAGLPLPAARVVVPNGLDVEAWMRVAPPPEGSHVALAWGRDSPEKGFDRLPAAWRLVREALPDAELRIAGADPTEAGAGITASPAVGGDEIRALLAGARVVVVPSRFEAFGLVALEALAAGRTVVYSTDTGMAETIGDHGIAADAGDPRALAAAIVDAFTGPTASAPPPDFFTTWSEMTDQYLAIYRRVLSR
jgi:glycosyltransferase involved in cell wall biosynthesis